MPSSSPEAISTVVGLIWNLAPKQVLDVGAGYGKYGVLFREYLELRHRREMGPEWTGSSIWTDRLIHIDALEGFGDYVGNLHHIIYDNVYVENIFDFIKKQWEYDVIFMGDVLEHIEKQVAVDELLPILLIRAKMGVLISVPMNAKTQPAQFGNKLEEHRSKWNTHDFRGAAPFTYTGRRGNHLISFLTKKAYYYKIVRGNILRRKLRALRRALQDSW